MASSSASHSAHSVASSAATSSSASYEVISHTHKSATWEFFEMIKLSDGTKKARCKRCGRQLSLGGNSTLHRHATSCNSRSAPEETQAQIGPGGYSWSYDQQLQRDLQMKCVISRGMPFNTFDNERMTKYIQQGLQPKYQKISRFSIRRDAYKAYMKAKKELIQIFKNFDGRFSLTSDVWTSGLNLGISYICITCHWIDDNWQMHKRIICFETFEHPHTGQAIYTVVMSCTQDFGIRDKLFSISFDNASNNTSAVGMLIRNLNPPFEGVFFHTRCFCHILNLVVQVALENPFFKFYITKIKTMLVFIYSSSKRRQEFKKFVHSKGEKFLKPEFDMPIRWNSTYKMLQRALRQKLILIEYYSLHNTIVENDISDSDWEIVESLTKFLEVFYDATKILSGIYYPTSPLVIGQVLVISLTFRKYTTIDIWTTLIHQMEEKFVKYIRCMSPAFACAAALNPLIGVEGVEGILEDIAYNLGLSSEEECNKLITVDSYKTSLNAMYAHYETFYGTRSRDSSSSSSRSSHLDPGSANEVIMQSAARKKLRTARDLNELASYIRTDYSLIFSHESSSTSFDILQWWRNNSRQYPVLSAMARDLLTIQASTVASESAFSCSGRILNERRSRLSPQAMEICICYKDYLDAEERKQDVNAIEDSAEEVEDEMVEVTEDED